MKPTSFLSEHSVELVLVPAAIKILRSQYPLVTPFYYWASREGGSVSAQSFYNKILRVIALYPRRPKIERIRDSKISVKVNELLCDRAHYFIQEGIPCIAGVPLCNCFEDFHMETPCAWFEITHEYFERTITFDLAFTNDSNEIPSLSHNEILAIAEQKTKEMSWPQLRQIIRNISRSENMGYYWNRMSGDLYKPIYLVLH